MSAQKKDSLVFVVKIGTTTLTHESGLLNLKWIKRFVCVICDICNMGHKVIVVSSGAIGAGTGRLNLGRRPDDLATKQAAAAVGQCELMSIYSSFFSDHGYTVAQMLLTLDVIENENRKKNAENTLARLLELGVVPIINENDSISSFEIEHITSFGDNDTLAGVVARLAHADRFILLSDIDGLYDSDPRKNPGAKLIKTVRKIDESIEGMAGGPGSEKGTGGMSTKLSAAIIAAQGGIPTNIINGADPDGLYAIISGENPGTEFLLEGYGQ